MTLQMKYNEKYEQGKQDGRLEGTVLTLDELGYSVSEIAKKLNQPEDAVLKILESED